MKIDYYTEENSNYIILLAHSRSEIMELDAMAEFMDNSDVTKYPEFTRLITADKHKKTVGIVYRVGCMLDTND